MIPEIDNLIEGAKRKEQMKRWLVTIHVTFQKQFGYIPMKDFKEMKSTVMWRQLSELREQALEEKKQMEKSKNKGKGKK